MAEVPLRQVQILAGHAVYATAEKFYVHLTPQRDDGAQGEANLLIRHCDHCDQSIEKC